MEAGEGAAARAAEMATPLPTQEVCIYIYSRPIQRIAKLYENTCTKSTKIYFTFRQCLPSHFRGAHVELRQEPLSV